MFLALIKKDLLLIRRYVVLLIALNLSVPFIMTMNTSFVGPMGFFIIVSATAYLVLIATGAKEMQYPRAASLLCAAPYSRGMMVLSKYVVIFLPYGFSCAAFWGMSFLKPQIGGMTPGMAVMGFLTLAVAVGIYMPLQFRLGYEKARYLIMAAYLVLVCGAPMLSTAVSNSVKTGALQAFPDFSAVRPRFWKEQRRRRWRLDFWRRELRLLPCRSGRLWRSTNGWIWDK